MSLATYRAAVVDRLRQTLPMLRSVEPYGGAFTRRELERVIANVPCVFVVALGVVSGAKEGSGQSMVRAEFAAYILTRREGGAEGENVAWNIALAVLQQIGGRHFTKGFGLPYDEAVENLWTGELDREGMALLAVTWSVDLLVGYNWLERDLQYQQADFVYPTEVIIEESIHGRPDRPAAVSAGGDGDPSAEHDAGGDGLGG